MKKTIIASLLASMLILSACVDEASSSSEASSEAVSSEASSTEATSSEAAETVDTLYPQIEEDNVERDLATIKTNMGDITVEFYPEHAPLAVENFLTHAENDYYDGIIFHRVIEDFMIQGGDPLGEGYGGESIWGQPFDNEVTDEVRHFRGALSMANSGPNTNGSQFFIVSAKTVDEGFRQAMEDALWSDEVIDAYFELGGTPHLDGQHTVFGQVTEGMDIVEAIEAVETDSGDKPVEPVVIEDIVVTRAE